MIYPYGCIYKTQRKIFAWQDRDTGGDLFVKYKSSSHLIICDSIDELKTVLNAESLADFCEQYAEMDFDRFWKTVKYLKTGRASSIKTCTILLDGWNFIEDVIRTIGSEADLLTLRTPVLDDVYEKVFCGVNLPSITPENREYNPIWTEEEILLFRQAMRWAWHNFFPKHEFY